MVINNRLLNNIKEFLYYANYGKYAKQKEVLFVEKLLESAKQKVNKLKKTHEIMRQKNTHKKKGIRRRDKKK